MLLRGEVWTHKTSLSSPLFIGVPVPRKGSEWSCICVLMVSFTSFYDVSIGIWKCSDSVVFFGGNVPTVWYFWGKFSDSVVFFGGNVPTVWYFFGKCSDSVVFLGGNVPTVWYLLEEMFRQCGIFGGKCSDSVVFFGGNVPTVWYFWMEMFRQCGVFGRKCSDSVVFFGGNVPTLWYFLLFILLFAQNKIRFIVDVFVRSRLIII
jgi:hypothetical protein